MSISKKPTKLCLLGSPLAGKTCFLAGLAILGEPDRKSPFTIVCKGDAHRYIRGLAATLRGQAWPAPTNKAEKIEAHILFKGASVDLTLLDYPGGDFTDYLALCDDATIQELNNNYQEADFFLMLMDPDLDIRRQAGMSDEQTEQMIERQTAQINSAVRAIEQRRESGVPMPELCLILTKADRYPDLQDSKLARRFVEEKAPNLIERLDKLFGEKTRVFALSATGGDAGTQSNNDLPPKNLAPRGYEELFDWVVNRSWWRINRSRIQKILMASGIPVFVALLGLSIVGIMDQAYLHEMTADRLSALKKLELSPPWFPVFVDPPQLREEVSRNEIARVKVKAGPEADLAQLEENEGLCQKIILSMPPGRVEWEKLLEHINKQKEEMLIIRIRNTEKSSPGECLDHALRYLKQFPQGKHSEEVLAVKTRFDNDREEQAKLAIRQVVVVNSQTMSIKAGLIDKYIVQFKPKEAAAMKNAVNLASQFGNSQQYHLSTKSCAGFTGKYNIMLWYFVNGMNQHKLDSIMAGNDFQWPDTPFSFFWKSGDTIAVDLYDDGYLWNNIMATFPFSNGPAHLLELLDGLPFSPTPKYPGEKGINLVVEISDANGPITQEKLQSFRDYILPGKSW